MAPLDWLPRWLHGVNVFGKSNEGDLLLLVLTIAINCIIFLLCLLLVSIIRKYDQKIFTPKQYKSPDESPPKLSTKSLFGWIVDMYRIEDETVLKYAGYDAFFLIRFYKLSLKILLIVSIYCWLILIPADG
jgi:hypothetical protein